MTWIWIAATWLVVAPSVALLVARGIRMADGRAPQARDEPNVVAEVGYLPFSRYTDEVDTPTHPSANGSARRPPGG